MISLPRARSTSNKYGGFTSNTSEDPKSCCIRIFTDSEFDAPAEPLLRELGIINFKELIRYNTAVMMHTIKYGQSPSYLQEMVHTVAEVHKKYPRNSEIDC